MPKLLGYRIVWTVHEVIPYNACTSNDVSVAKILSRISDAKIVHSKSTISQMRVMGLSTRNTILIPHGNYKNAYSDNLSASESRKRLKIKSHEMVILFFGLIRPYKGVDQLLDSFGNLKAKFPDLHLIIAGKSRDEKMSLQIQQVAKNGNVIFVNDYIEDTEVGKFFKAADVVCLPFKTTTTSGSALLALTFGRALVAPKVGSLVDLPSSVGYFYDPADSTALEKNIEKAIKNRQEVRIMSRNAKRYANSLSWSSIAEKTLQLYSSVLKPHVPRRYRDEND
ncbi:MAG TPA: glycosyltransferase [Candidatus Saccharimonadales bacterium]|nr:glycosyltransferase [Candidatus Saccharimonadales bacterium]